MTKYYLYVKANETENNRDAAIKRFDNLSDLKKEKLFFESLGYYCAIKIW